MNKQLTSGRGWKGSSLLPCHGRENVIITKYQKSSCLWNPWREGACRSTPQLPSGDHKLPAQCLSSCHLTASLTSSSQRRKKHNRVKSQKPSDSLFFRTPLFLDVWPKPLCLCFLKSRLQSKPVPSALPRATWTSLHILRKHKTQSPHLGQEKELQGTLQGTTAERLLSHNGRFLQWAWVHSYVPGLLAQQLPSGRWLTTCCLWARGQ